MHVAITADSVDPERVNVIEVWRNAEALSKWWKQSKPPKVDKPKHVEMKRYDATDGGPLF
jgi:heme-degrading monooxygenase HmoA